MFQCSLQRSKGMTALLTILLVLQLSNPAAFGQSAAAPPVTYQFTTYVDNQAAVNNCSAGEPVNLNGTVQFTYQVATDSTGMNNFTITATNNLTGVGQTTSTNYLAGDSNDYAASTSDTSKDLTVQLSSDLKSQGSTPSMSLVQTLHITVDTSGNISASVVDNTTSCGSSAN
jgi:hypothetical protein